MAVVNLKACSKGVTVLIIISVVIMLGCVLAYIGAAGKLKTITADLDAKEKQVRESTKMAQQLEESKLGYMDAQAQVRFLETTVATRSYIPTLLKQLEHLGRSVSLKVVGVRPIAKEVAPVQRSISSGRQASEGNVQAASQPKPGEPASQEQLEEKPYDELKINLEVEGKYMNALDFLYKLTTFPKIVTVNTMDISPAKYETLVSPRLTIKMEVTAFVLKEPTDDATKDAKAQLPSDRSAKKQPVSTGGSRNEAG